LLKHSTRPILGKLGLGSACAVCCLLPMLVLTGVVAGATLAIGGAVFAAIAVVVTMAVLVATGRVNVVASKARLLLVAVGGAGGFVGLWAISNEKSGGASIVALSVAVLAAAALLSLPGAGLGEGHS
jgi:hypothetical protein